MSGPKIQDFTDLIAWQKAHQLVLTIYEHAKLFPENERFVLTSQITRAAISITSNIAEGFGINTGKDKSHFFAIAKGSLLETRSQMRIAKDLEYISESEFQQFEAQAIEVTELTAGIIRSNKNL